jgi:tellurite resistance protein
MEAKMSNVEPNRLKNFPVNFLAVLLGLMGYSLALQKAESIIHFPFPIYLFVLYLTLALFAGFLVVYTIKFIKYPTDVQNEFKHPIKVNFYPILAKLFLILSIIFIPLNVQWSKYFWFIGVALQFTFSVVMMYIWISHTKFEIHHLNASWFIPIVGNVIIPIAGSHHGYTEISWFFFSIGLVMWITLFVIVFNRIIFHHPIPDRLIPTSFILFAPPAIAFIAYVKLTGAIDPFARILYYISLFLVIVVFSQVKKYSKLKFYISWWAYTFPTVAFTIATILIYHKTQFAFFYALSYGMIVLLSMIMIYVTYRTIKAVNHLEICIEE